MLQLVFNSRNERRDIYFCTGKCQLSCFSLEMYPNQKQPNHKLFENLYNRLGETGSFRSKTTKRTIVDHEEELLVSYNPGITGLPILQQV